MPDSLTIAVRFAGFSTRKFCWNDPLVAADLAPNAVGYSELQANTVDTSKVIDNSVTNADIADNTVRSNELASDAASLNKVSGGVMTSDGTRIGINTASPTSRLHVVSGATTGPMALFEGTSSANQWIRTGNSIAHITMGVDGTTGATSGDGYVYSSSDNFFIGVSDTPTVYVDGMVSGNVGIGTTGPTNRLHVRGSIAGTASNPANHIALIENTSTNNAAGVGADVLALKMGANANQYTNFVTFHDSGGCIGEIQGFGACNGTCGSGGSGCGNTNGVCYKTTGCDYAEYLPKENPGDIIDGGMIVGISGGSVSLRTRGAAGVAVVSRTSAVLAKMPPKGTESDYEIIAFLGQVPVNIRGPVQAGDYVIPSGNNDGIGVGVSPGDMEADQVAQVVAQAWASSDEPGVKKVNCLVGLSVGQRANERLVARMKSQQRQIDELVARLEAVERASGVARSSFGGAMGAVQPVALILAGLVGGMYAVRRGRVGEDGGR